jgi:NodT family efflux transporter outer membrane factor (OMF) lipoprotein
LVKALVDVTGIAEPSLRALLDKAPDVLPQPEKFAVETVPVTVLQHRPDVVSAERELAASNAEIGAAVADQYPSVSLTGSISRSGVSLSQLATSWLFGPTISLPIFDAGSRAAAVDTAEASYKAQLATYKQSIRTAIKEVEQDLVRLDSATKREANARSAAERYRRYEATTNEYYKSGGASALTLETARRNTISAEVNALTVRRDQIEYWIALYKATGGGWSGLADASKQ